MAALIHTPPGAVDIAHSYYDSSNARSKASKREAYPASGIGAYRVRHVNALNPDLDFHVI
jgi:hypothetical protein